MFTRCRTVCLSQEFWLWGGVEWLSSQFLYIIGLVTTSYQGPAHRVTSGARGWGSGEHTAVGGIELGGGMRWVEAQVALVEREQGSQAIGAESCRREKAKQLEFRAKRD